MRIIAMSDSHGSKRALDMVFQKAADNGDIFIHLGDGAKELEQIRVEFPQLDIRHVTGNCDWSCSDPLLSIVEADGVKILCTHGHRYNVKYGTELIRSLARDYGCRVVLFGHTHCRYEAYEDGIYMLNPGSCSCPRDANKPSYGFVDIINGQIVTNIVDLL